MSGVLKRMAKQAMGTLPTVQPLTPPHFAPHGGGLRQTAFEHETNAEVDVPAPFSSPVPAPRPELSPRESRETGRDAAEGIGDLPAQSAQGSTTQPREPIQPREPMPPREPMQPPRIATRRETAQEERPAGRVEPMTSVWEGKPGRSEDAIEAEKPARSKSSEPELEIGAQSLARTEERPAAQIRPRPDPFAPQEHSKTKSSREGAEIVRDVESKARISRERKEQAIETRPSQRAAFAKRTEPVAAPTEQRTEIHISIGSIELRAPRVEAKPQAAPFRPRVTLDDFLRRKPEAGA
jgi:hypothetical protein